MMRRSTSAGDIRRRSWNALLAFSADVLATNL